MSKNHDMFWTLILLLATLVEMISSKFWTVISIPTGLYSRFINSNLIWDLWTYVQNTQGSRKFRNLKTEWNTEKQNNTSVPWVLNVYWLCFLGVAMHSSLWHRDWFFYIVDLRTYKTICSFCSFLNDFIQFQNGSYDRKSVQI